MTAKKFRISSTTLSTFLDCPRKWYYQNIEGKELVESYPMAVGTITHAILEFRMQRGFWPPRTQIRRMEGNYSDPVESMRAHPGAYEEATELARAVDLKALFPDGWADMECEVPLERFGLDILGVPCTGFIDIDDPQNQTIRDWKSRGRLDYAPRTAGDFHDDVQLSYYAAACRKARGWDSVTVQHINLLRPSSSGGPKVWPVEARLDGWYLDRVWEKLENEVVPQMLEMAETGKAPRNEKSCFKYGKCSHLKYCTPEGADEKGFFELAGDTYAADMLNDLNDLDDDEDNWLKNAEERLSETSTDETDMELLSPETPPDLEPVPYEEKTVDELGFDTRQCSNLAAAGIRTLEDLDNFIFSDDGDLTDIPYIGPKSVPPALEILESMKQGRP